MKKSAILFLGILLGTIVVSQHLFSRSVMVHENDPAGVEQGVNEINVFPNPSDGRFQLSFESSEKGQISAKVFDITGKLVKNITEDLVINETSVTATIDLDSPATGIYFIRIEMGSRLLTKKIIIR
jgi:hypothetical protein